MIKFASSLCLVAFASASWRPGKCAEYSTKADFDAQKYSGFWYEVVKDRLNLYDLRNSCTTAYYTANDDGSVGVYNHGYSPKRGYGGITGKAVPSNVSGSGSLVVEFFGEPDPNQPGNYNVVDTDYETFTIVYDCDDHNAKGLNYVYETFGILARDKDISDEKIEEIAAIMKEKVPGYMYETFTVRTTQGGDCDYDYSPMPSFLQ